jgi:hypothetical protein
LADKTLKAVEIGTERALPVSSAGRPPDTDQAMGPADGQHPEIAGTLDGRS